MSDKKNEATGKAFELYDLRKEIMNIDYSLQLVSKNCNTLNINLKRQEIVQKEINSLDPSCRIYDRCGRIFVLSDKESLLKKMDTNKKQMIEELKTQNEKKQYLEKSLQEKSKAYMEVAKTPSK
jgi:chaperonin cofactor prefoldin